MSEADEAQHEMMMASAAALRAAADSLHAVVAAAKDDEEFTEEDTAPCEAIKNMNSAILLYAKILPIFDAGYGYPLLTATIAGEGTR